MHCLKHCFPLTQGKPENINTPRRHFWDPGRPGLWSPDFLLKITLQSPDSRVRAGQGPKNASWADNWSRLHWTIVCVKNYQNYHHRTKVEPNGFYLYQHFGNPVFTSGQISIGNLTLGGTTVWCIQKSQCLVVSLPLKASPPEMLNILSQYIYPKPAFGIYLYKGMGGEETYLYFHAWSSCTCKSTVQIAMHAPLEMVNILSISLVYLWYIYLGTVCSRPPGAK